MKKKKTYWNVTQTMLLSMSICDQTIKTEPISLEIFLVLFTVRLREVISNPADPKKVSVSA